MSSPDLIEETIRKANFFDSLDFREFMLPLIAERKRQHFADYISKGGDEWRIKIREQDELLDDIKIAIEKAEGIREERG